MTKPVANIAVQIRRLEAAREAAKSLPRGTVLSAEPMAELVGMTWTALRGWCRNIEGFAESGAFVGGGNGINYEFKPLKAVDFLLRHFRNAQKVAAKKQARIREIVGGTALASVTEELTLDELKKMIELSIKVQDQLERQGKLMDAEKLRAAVTTMISKIQQAVLRGPMEQDPTGQWTAEMRDAFETMNRKLLGRIENAARECLTAMTPSR